MKRLLTALAVWLGMAAPALAFPSTAGADSNGAQVLNSPISIETFSTCTNEGVLVTGVFHIVSQTFTDPAGIFHEHIQLSLSNGKGVGENEGGLPPTQYVMTEAITSVDTGPAALTEVLNSNLIGQGSVPNQSIQIRFHITVNANGDVTTDFVSATTSCQG
jgi:hypothetical protein